jgi:membrane-bound lytic murein transglycosylase B
VTALSFRPLLFAVLLMLAVSPTRALEIRDWPEVRAFVDEMAQRHGFPAAELEQLFADVQLQPGVIEAIERPGEARPWYEYRKQFLTEQHVRRGLAYWKQHQAALDRASRDYGVPPEIILGILGVETSYGRNPGRYRVIDALATLWLQHPPRAGFFRRELEEFLLLAREQKLDPRSVRGSYAGAIGIAQFIPSSYRRYAVDFDGDGRRDLAGNPADAIGSIANFLRVHGWSSMDPVSDTVRLEGTQYFWVEKFGVRPVLSVRELVRYGIYPLQHTNNTDRRASLLSFEGEDGPFYRLGYNNFYVITRYNRSKRYALAVLELSERLREARAAEQEP